MMAFSLPLVIRLRVNHEQLLIDERIRRSRLALLFVHIALHIPILIIYRPAAYL